MWHMAAQTKMYLPIKLSKVLIAKKKNEYKMKKKQRHTFLEIIDTLLVRMQAKALQTSQLGVSGTTAGGRKRGRKGDLKKRNEKSPSTNHT